MNRKNCLCFILIIFTLMFDTFNVAFLNISINFLHRKNPSTDSKLLNGCVLFYINYQINSDKQC